MGVRIISGQFGGRVIASPEGKTTHPMGDRIRGSVFSIISDEIVDAEVLDAFAGTGSLGLESVSRGAHHATFVERDRKTFRILNENIQKLEVDDITTTSQMGLKTWIDVNADKRFDVIFADPPYKNLQLSTVSYLTKLLKPNGLMVLSYLGRCEVPILDQKIVVVDNRRYGENAAIAFYRWE